MDFRLDRCKQACRRNPLEASNRRLLLAFAFGPTSLVPCDVVEAVALKKVAIALVQLVAIPIWYPVEVGKGDSELSTHAAVVVLDQPAALFVDEARHDIDCRGLAREPDFVVRDQHTPKDNQPSLFYCQDLQR